MNDVPKIVQECSKCPSISMHEIPDANSVSIQRFSAAVKEE
jgi:hypothetical protein